MKKIIILMLILMTAIAGLWGQTSPINETFSNLGPYDGYQEETWTGDQGGTWTATDARTDQSIDEDAICIRNGILTSPLVSGGIGDLTLTTQRAFSGGTGDLTIKVNGTTVGTIPYNDTEQTSSINGINTANDIVVTIETPGNGDRIIMDNLQWTAFSDGGATPPSISNITQTSETDITSSTNVSVSAEVTAGDAAISNVKLRYNLDNNFSMYQEISMSIPARAVYTTDNTITAEDGETVYYIIYAEDVDGESTTSTVQSYTVNDPATATLPYTQGFNADLDDCYTYNVSGESKEWYWYHEGFASMNGYNSGDTEEDWLILPSINLENFSNENLSFSTSYNYGSDDENNYLKLYYSTDYSGLGDPTSATWSELSYTTPESNQTWTSSGDISLSDITATNVHIAFQYHYEPGNYRLWQIDNIEIVDLAANQAPEISDVIQNPTAGITSSTTVSVSADITDSDGSVVFAQLRWGTDADLTIYETIEMVAPLPLRAVYSTLSGIPAQADGSTVYYAVYAMDNDDAETLTDIYNYTVTDPSTTTLPYDETFDTDLGDCLAYSVSGATKEWYWDANGNAEINGYNSGHLEEDWLILPGVNLDNYSNEILTFETAYNYGTDDVDNYLKLYYSTNYSGQGNPNTSRAEWTELSFTQPSSGNYTVTSSGDISLSEISGEMVYLAFKYNYNPGSYRAWEIDNISIYEGEANPTTISDISHTPEIPTSSEFVTVSATITDNDGITGADIVWGTTSGDLSNTVAMSNEGDVYSGSIPAQTDGTTVYYAIYAMDSSTGLNETTSAEYSYTVTNPTIDSFPYTENFDSVTAPALPAGWIKLNDTENSAVKVETTDQYSHSGPNSVKLYNSYANTGNIILISPLATQSIAYTRIKFWAKTPSADVSLVVGTMTDPADAATFSIVETVLINSADFAEYTVNLSQTSTRENVRVAFKHNLEDTYDDYFIDDFTWEETGETPDIPNLIISEVADPGDNYNARFVELYNAGDSEIDFSSQTIYFDRQSNGGNHSSIQLTGAVAAGATYVIGNASNIDAAYGDGTADLDFGSVTGNGDDGYFLYFGGDETSGTLMDAYGVVDVHGDDQEWEYDDSRAVRNSNITTPNATWTAAEWTITAADVADMTPGVHPDPSENPTPAAPQNVTIEVSGDDIVISWEAVTTDIDGNPATISGYKVYWSETPEIGVDATVSDLITETSFSHDGAALSNKLFYKVIAIIE